GLTHLLSDDLPGGQVQHGRRGVITRYQREFAVSLTKGFKSLEHRVIALISADLFRVPTRNVATKYIDESRVPCPRSRVLRELDKVLVPRDRACGDFEVSLDHHFANNETAIVMPLSPILSVHLRSQELRDLRLGLEDGPEGPEIDVFIAPGVDTVHVID